MQRAICCRIFTPAQPAYPAASVRDYCSGALTFEGPEFDPVIEEVRRVLSSGPDGALMKRWSFFHSNVGEPPLSVSAAAAARVLGQKHTSVAQSIADGKLVGESRLMGRRRAHLVTVESLQRAVDDRAQSIVAGSAARILGVSQFQIESFRRCGLLLPQREAQRFKREYRFRMEDIESFINGLADLSSHSLVDGNHIRLSDVPAYRHARLSDLIADIFRGAVKVFCDSESKVSEPILKRLFVHRDFIFGSQRSDGNILLGVKAAARQLRLSTRMIPILVKAKCLDAVGEQSGNNLSKCSVTSTSVTAFRSQFVLARELAKTHATSTRAIGDRARAAGIKPVIRSNTRRGISAVWRTTDIVHLNVRSTTRAGLSNQRKSVRRYCSEDRQRNRALKR